MAGKGPLTGGFNRRLAPTETRPRRSRRGISRAAAYNAAFTRRPYQRPGPYRNSARTRPSDAGSTAGSEGRKYWMRLFWVSAT